MSLRAISGAASLAGVIGWPVSQSRSPALHGFWIDQYGLDAAYVPLPVHPDDLAAVVAALPKMGFCGCSVTLPHKERLLDLAEPDDFARRAGAANTLIFNEGQALCRNTDGFGFIAHLRATVPDWQPGIVTVLGAGGAARGIIAALLDAGVREIRLVNRDQGRAEALAAALGGPIRVLSWSAADAALEGAGLLVNSTALGMSGQPPLHLDLAPLPLGAVVYDIVYKPLQTDLLRAAEGRGLVPVDGLGMLLWQAQAQFHAWFGVHPPVTPALRRAVLDARG